MSMDIGRRSERDRDNAGLIKSITTPVHVGSTD